MIKIKGYIEGYYGKLISWEDRRSILDKLSKCKFNFYFYAPKEDIKNRFKWREPYNKTWLRNFTNFIKYAKKKNVKIISGISPGLDFNFKSYLNGNNYDLSILKNKIKTFLSCRVDYVAILFDDIPNDFNLKVPNEKEGLVHSKIINEIISDLNITIFSVPRIYSDELIIENQNYLKDFFENINEKNFTFYSGQNIVSKNFISKEKIIKEKIKDNKIVYWDNFYANDYCPQRLIIGPWKNNNLLNKSMINGTGMIETDKLIIDIVSKMGSSKNKYLKWKEIMTKNKIPKQFLKISKPFLTPNFTNEHKIENINYNKQFYKNLDYLLWNWKSPLSVEWFPFLLNFKHNLQILHKELTYDRILKTQNNPIQKILLKREE